ncbi:MAG: hypothetical protein IJS78_02005 [Clostridia bacterium]|nr:hypothetical protein [Clostridia bacterium]
MTYQAVRQPNKARPADLYNGRPRVRQNEGRRPAAVGGPRAVSREELVRRENARRARAEREARERAYYERLERERRRNAAIAEEQRRRLEYVKAYERRLKAERREAARKERAEERARARAAEREAAKREIRVEKSRISFPFIAILTVAAIMIMAVIFSYAQVSGASRQLSEAKETLSALQAERSDLTFALEEKNDIRQIEKIATEKIGMVKEGAVTKRFISMADGDSIELEIPAEEDGNGGSRGFLLSAVAGIIDNIRDYLG